MAGIVFVRTTDLSRIVGFYRETVGMREWLSQPGISILRHGNFLVGFHESDTADVDSLLTFFYRTREEVDEMHGRLGERALAPPRENERYRIYNFFATDPDGRKLECQVFLHDLPSAPIDLFS